MLRTWVISTRGCSLQAAFASCIRLELDTLNPTRKYVHMYNGLLLHAYGLQLPPRIQAGNETVLIKTKKYHAHRVEAVSRTAYS